MDQMGVSNRRFRSGRPQTKCAPGGAVADRHRAHRGSSSQRRTSRARRAHAALLAALVALLALASAPGAAASKGVHAFFPSLTGVSSAGGKFNNPRGVAVNHSTGDVYVAEQINNRVQQFSSTGEFIRAWGVDVVAAGLPGDLGSDTFEICTVADYCKNGINSIAPNPGGALGSPQGLAIDQGSGAVYVADEANRRVQRFDASGHFELAFGKDVVQPFHAGDTGTGTEVCTVAADCQAGVTGSAGGELGSSVGRLYLAVAPPGAPNAGNVLVADPGNRRGQEFSSGGAFVRTFGFDVAGPGAGFEDTGTDFEVCTQAIAGAANCKVGAASGSGVGQFGTNGPNRIAVDSGGAIYTVESANPNFRVQKFTPQPGPPPLAPSIFAAATLSGTAATSSPTDVAIGASDDVFVVKAFAAGTGNPAAVAAERRVLEFDSTGTLQDTHLARALINSVNGLAHGSDGRLYVSSQSFGTQPSGSPTVFASRVYLLDDVAAPVASIDPIASVSAHTADFSGSVDPNGGPTSYRFEYVDDAEFQTNGFANATRLPVIDADAGAGNTGAAVEHTAGLPPSPLAPGTLYHVRLVATQIFTPDTVTTAAESFTTPSAAPQVGAWSITARATSALLAGTVNPNGETTSYHFEYGDRGPCDASPCTSTPGASAGSGSSAVVVSDSVSGLEPAHGYHFRIVASNATGTTAGPDHSFTTTPVGEHLPDDRAYELVTPPDTNGTSPFAKTLGEGEFDNGFETPLVSAAGDSAIFQVRGALPGFPGAGSNDVYRASRGQGGWSTATLTPSGAESEQPLAGGISPDHRYSFWSTTAGEDGSLVIGGQPTRYVREPGGTFELIGRGSLADDPYAQGRLITAGAGHIVFTSTLQLEPDAPAAVGPGGPISNGGGVPGNPAVAAVYDRSPAGPTRVVSLLPGDVTPPLGTTTYFRGVAADGSAVVFNVGSTMYVRRNNNTTVEVAAAASPDALGYAGVSPGGGRVFYVKADGSDPSVGRLFAFDADSQTTSPITSAGGARFVNVSADGSRVYFVSPEQLNDDNGAEGAHNLYVWDGSSTRFIAIVTTLDLRPSGDNEGVALGAWSPNNGALKTSLIGLAFDPSRTTPDGSVFVFESRARLTAYDSAGFIEVYRYDADSNELACVSCSPSGAPPLSDATLQSKPNQGILRALMPVASLSDDGGSVFFESADALVPGDTNSPCTPVPIGLSGTVLVFPCRDVYRWKDGDLSLISSGRSSAASSIWGVSHDARDALFLTADPLVPQDPPGGEPSLYDARVGGGFPAGQASDPCVEDACQGDGSLPAVLPTVATVTFVGLGNATPTGPLRASERVSVTRPKPVRGFAAKLRVRAPAAGLVTVSGASVVRASKRLSRAGAVTIPVRLTAKGRRALERKGTLKLTLRVGFSRATGPTSATRVALTFRRPRSKTTKRSAVTSASRARHASTTRGEGR